MGSASLGSLAKVEDSRSWVCPRDIRSSAVRRIAITEAWILLGTGVY